MLYFWNSYGPQFAVSFAFMIILAISVHEMAHAWMAKRCGDDTAERLGRLTINPTVHFDPIGFFCVLFMPIGWGKPVPYNPYNLGHVRRDGMYIALAGPVSNIIQAVALAFIYRFIEIPFIANMIFNLPFGSAILSAAGTVCFVGVLVNLMLAFFNMIPLFPLDGEKIAIGILPHEQATMLEDFRQYSTVVLMVLFMYPFVLGIPGIIGIYLQSTAFPLLLLMIG